MRIPAPLPGLLLLICALSANAANEWKNPDAAAPPAKPARPAPAPAAAAPAPLPAPAPAAATPAPAGQLSLNAMRVCDYQRSYVDKGSGGKIDGAFYIPRVPAGYFMIGGYAQGNYHDPSDCVIAVKPSTPQSMSLLQAPQQSQRLWTDKGSGANMDGSIWQPVPQSSDYACLGSIATQGYDNPGLGNYACVHRCLVENIPAGGPVWSTSGTGANQTAYVYKLHNSNSMFTVSDNRRPTNLQDIRGALSCAF